MYLQYTACKAKVFLFLFIFFTIFSPSATKSAPHGGHLVDRFVLQPEFEKRLHHVKKNLEINKKNYDDSECIASGIYSPLKGFMNKADYEGVVSKMRLRSGLLWPLLWA